MSPEEAIAGPQVKPSVGDRTAEQQEDPRSIRLPSYARGTEHIPHTTTSIKGQTNAYAMVSSYL
jgi:hypothetical protein